MLDLSDNPIRLSLLHASWPQPASRAANSMDGAHSSRAQRIGAGSHGLREQQMLTEFDGLVDELRALGFEF